MLKLVKRILGQQMEKEFTRVFCWVIKKLFWEAVANAMGAPDFKIVQLVHGL